MHTWRHELFKHHCLDSLGCENTDSLSYTANFEGSIILVQWFSKLNHASEWLEGLLKNRLLDPTPWFLIQWVWYVAFLISSQVMLTLRVWRPHSANQFLHGLSASQFLETLLERHLLGLLPPMVLLPTMALPYSHFWGGAWKSALKHSQQFFCSLKFENRWSKVTRTRSFPVVFKTAWCQPN